MSKHYSEQEKEQLLAEQKLSGLSVSGFCRSKGVSDSTFFGWLRKSEKGLEDRFTRINSSKQIELELYGGLKIRVYPEDIRVVLEALR